MPKPYPMQDINPFKALVVEKTANPSLNIVLLHGYGANALNLFPLHRYLDIDTPIKWIFPEAIHPIDSSGVGKAWFPLNAEAISLGKGFADTNPPGLDQMVKMVEQALTPLSQSDTPLLIGGFSQGAMLSINVVMKTHLKVSGLIVLSGAVLDRKNWKPEVFQRQGLAFFQSHGYTDTILKYEEGQKLEVALQACGLKGELLSFEGGHEIPLDVLTNLKKFLCSFHSS